ncbi:MAG: bifunctional pyr operon transcriptional regulator/uracil phosphoribosyltransferase PyrR [Candidatus Muiribacteriota bacterium]
MIAKTIIGKEEFERILKRLALQIVEKNIDNIKSLAFIGIKQRGVPLAKRLADYIRNNEGFEIPIGELDISLYRDDQTEISGEPLLYGQAIDFSFSDKNLIVIDDILNTGKTVRASMEAILDRGKPLSIQLCVIGDTRNRIYPVSADFTGNRLRVSRKEYLKINVTEIDGEDSIQIIKKEG